MSFQILCSSPLSYFSLRTTVTPKTRVHQSCVLNESAFSAELGSVCLRTSSSRDARVPQFRCAAIPSLPEQKSSCYISFPKHILHIPKSFSNTDFALPRGPQLHLRRLASAASIAAACLTELSCQYIAHGRGSQKTTRTAPYFSPSTAGLARSGAKQTFPI